jgi:predicted extracellular nuclease
VLISAVQGSGAASPLLGQTVTVEAIVVGDFQGGGALQGFFLQEQDADADGDAMTSEGIFVFDGSAPAADVAAGDLVRVTGTVAEFLGKTQLSGVTVEVVSGGNALPTAAEITFPVASLAESGGQLTADLEMYEGMLVTVPQELTVGDVFNLGRFGEIDLNALGTIPTYTQINLPDVDGYRTHIEEAAKNAIVLDDGRSSQNPDTLPFEIAGEPGNIAGQLDAGDELGSGDTVSGLTGVLDFAFDQYRIQPTETPEFVNANPREHEAPEVGGTLKVATFNVLNYFTTLGDEGLTSGPTGMDPRGADNAIEFVRQTDKLIAALSEIHADVFSLLEIENEFGDQNGDGEFAIATLVAELNDATGASYLWVDPGTPYIGGDAISVGMIYNSQTVRIADGTSVEFLSDVDLAGLGLDFGNPVFEGEGTSRSPLAATFEQISTGEEFTVAVNHFTSKGSISPFGDNVDAGDGAGNNNEARLQAAMALDAWLDTNPTGSHDPDVLITGDLNSYAMEDPVQFLIAQGYVNLEAVFAGAGAYS